MRGPRESETTEELVSDELEILMELVGSREGIAPARPLLALPDVDVEDRVTL